MRANGGDPADGGRIASNTFAWTELLTRDPDMASRYYQRLFSLEQEKIRTPDGAVNHVLGKNNIARSSIVVNPFPEVGNHWLLYVVVDDLESTLAKVTAAGGDIYIKPHPAGVNQDTAIIADPTGGIVALYLRGGDES
jgi:predicted enzyme related to lactoylglutathione lyase